MKKIILLGLCILLVSINVLGVRPLEQTYHTKEALIKEFKQVCKLDSNNCVWLNVGKSLEGKDIVLFKVGNQNKPRLLIDASIHGWEDSGSEITLEYVRWLLTANTTETKDLLANNGLLIIPVVNMDSYKRENKRRINPDGSLVKYGVDLNRNFETQWLTGGSSNPDDRFPLGYRGYMPYSEPESQAIKDALNKYKPKAYLSIHMGGEPKYSACTSNSLLQALSKKYNDTINKQQETLKYNIKVECKNGGTSTLDAYTKGMFSLSTETLWTNEIPDTKKQFLDKYYKSNAIMITNILEIIR